MADHIKNIKYYFLCQGELFQTLKEKGSNVTGVATTLIFSPHIHHRGVGCRVFRRKELLGIKYLLSFLNKKKRKGPDFPSVKKITEDVLKISSSI